MEWLIMEIQFTKPPSVQRTVDAMGKLHNHLADRISLAGEDFHRATAIVEAANIAYRQGLLFAKDWRRQKHHAAACYELSRKAMAHETYRSSNVQIQVDIDYRKYRASMQSPVNRDVIECPLPSRRTGSIYRLYIAGSQIGVVYRKTDAEKWRRGVDVNIRPIA
jgi:hypothetical protein